MEQFFFSGVPAASLAPIFELYPNDPAQGSPFGTGNDNQLAPMYKRMAAFQGDMIFQAPRRFFLDQRSSQQDTWTFSTCDAIFQRTVIELTRTRTDSQRAWSQWRPWSRECIFSVV